MNETDWGGMGLGGARCAVHPEQLATRTCTRCGNFMCSTCAEGGAQTLCPSCQQRLGMEQRFPFNRDNWSFSELWDYCFDIFKREWLMLGVGVLVFFGVAFAANLVTSILPAIGGMANNSALSVVLTIVSTIMQQAVSGVMTLGLMRMLIDVLQGSKPDIGRIFSQIHKVGPYLITMLLVVLLVGVPIAALAGIVAGVGMVLHWDWESMWPVGVGVGVLAIIPLIYFTVPLYLLQAEIAFNDGASPTQMIRNCYAYARGEKLSILGVGIVGGLVVIAGTLACCVGALPAMGLSYLLMGGLYLSLRNGAQVDGEG
ncbi:hypothetical protein [Hyalangium versicolor]|uniref:hypothetical protein n=1 Tax=Hyalangium versicolor TaxID=2861190 RepID=UPI001CCE1B77|nr:hypothetical protein [Hyalangium versicolor]